jgi:hypothetical protein
MYLKHYLLRNLEWATVVRTKLNSIRAKRPFQLFPGRGSSSTNKISSYAMIAKKGT